MKATGQPTEARLRPELNGVRVRKHGEDAVYLIDEGKKRLIPDHETYDALFMDWSRIEQKVDADEIETGLPISSGAVLVQAAGQQSVWLVDNGHKRRVDGHPETVDKYHFKWPPLKVPAILIEHLPTGNPIQ